MESWTKYFIVSIAEKKCLKHNIISIKDFITRRLRTRGEVFQTVQVDQYASEGEYKPLIKSSAKKPTGTTVTQTLHAISDSRIIAILICTLCIQYAQLKLEDGVSCGYHALGCASKQQICLALTTRVVVYNQSSLDQC